MRRQFRSTILGAALALTCQTWLSAAEPQPVFDSASLPSLGDDSSRTLSPSAERRLGDHIMRSIAADPDLIDDPLLSEYLGEQWQGLLRSARARGDINGDIDDTFAWSTFLVRDRTVNAFALPGGYVGVHLGLIAITRNPEELASVLAHEMSHVTQRHIARMMTQSERISWVSMASMVLGALAASRSPEAAQALIFGGQSLSMQQQLSFSRDMEREADRIGFGVLTSAGYPPAGMMEMFEQLQMASRLNDDNSYPYLRSHPLTVERIGEARARLGTGSLKALQHPSTPLLHALMAARAKVLMDTRRAANELREALPTGNDSSMLVALYARLVTATQLKDEKLAQDTWPALLRLTTQLNTPDASTVKRMVQLSALEAQIATGHADLAVAALRPMLINKSGQSPRPETLLLAQAALATNPPESRETFKLVADKLQTITAIDRGDATAWALLSSTWGRLNDPLRALRADAENSASRGDLQGAIDRVKSARQRFNTADAGTLIEMSVMDTRLRTWQATLKEDATDK